MCDAPTCLTLTIPEAARLLGVGNRLGYELARRGELPGVLKLGHRYVVSRAALEAALGMDQEASLPTPEATLD